MCWQKSWRSGF
ncbi:hypothetical protein ID866_6887 [Astraeus odoratus]|nr:hypothetical protein ID866_6887 [Astraeus odoratus]